MTESLEQAQKIRNDALATAEQVKLHAAREAELAMTEAQKRASEMLHAAENRAAVQTEALRRENELLLQRRKAIMAQLRSLSGMATQTAPDFPDIDLDALEHDDPETAADQNSRSSESSMPRNSS